MTFTEQQSLAVDAVFIGRVTQAAVKLAIQVYNEPPSADKHAARAGFAQNVLINSDHYGKLFARGVATNPSVTALSTDGDIEFTISSMWNAFAGA